MTRMFLHYGFLAAALLLASQQARAEAARPCGERERIVARLAEKYGEGRQAIGLAVGNRVMEVFASPETGTWTVTLTDAAGIMCVVSAGEAFEALGEVAARGARL